MPSNDVVLAYLHPNQVGHNFHQSLLRMVMFDMANGQRLGQYLTMRAGSGGIVEARNEVWDQFMALDSRPEWCLWIDADMGFDCDALHQLLEVADPVERPIVGALCFAWKEVQPDGLGGYHCVARPTIFDWIEHPDGHKRFTGVDDYPRGEVVKCAGTGTAFLLVHRTVIEKVAESVDEQGRWFDRLKGSDGSRLGEDISFCVRAASAGFPIHVHTGVVTNHLKELWVQDSVFAEQQTLGRFLAAQEQAEDADGRT